MKTNAPRMEEFDTYDNMDLATGEKIEQDTHTLVRSDKKEIDKHGKLRESMVGMKEGVPGIYSGFERTEKKHGKLEKKGRILLKKLLLTVLFSDRCCYAF